MTTLYLLLSASAALGFYLSTSHQRLWAGAAARRGILRSAAWLLCAMAAAAAIAALGTWAGVFAALTAIMLASVLLPYADAWRAQRGSAGHAR